MTSHAFFMGCATAFFETAASATFLSRFAPSYLPWVYVAAACVNTLTGAVYSRAQARVSFARLMRGTIWFLIVIAAGARLGLAVSSLPWVAFAALVSYRIMSSLTDLEYWAVASRIYDVRQAKRLFGLIGTGEVVARIGASFSVPLFVSVFGVSNLMVLSVAGLGMCAVTLRMVLASAPGVSEPPAPRKPGAPSADLRGFVGEILAHPYLELVVGVAVLATFGKYFVDFAFLEQMSARGRGEEEVAGILGLFSGVTQTLSLLTRLFISRPLLHRFGIRVGVLVLPVLHVMCTLAILACGLLGFGEAVFVFVLGNQGVYKTFKHPIDNASFKVLYQPLKPEERLAAQIAVEVLFSPFVVGVSGGLMLLFTVAMPYEPVRFAVVMLVTFVAWTVAARAAGRRYGDKLQEMLQLRIEGNVVFPFEDATTLDLLRKRLDSPVAIDVCVALDLLEKSGAPDLVERLVETSGHPDAYVRGYAIGRLAEVRPEALRDRWAALAADAAPAVRAVALSAIARAGDGEAIARLAESDLQGDRLLAVQIAGDRDLPDIVRAALADSSPAVRRGALRAAGKLDRSFADGVLVDALRDPVLSQAAAQGLAARGDALLGRFDPFSALPRDRLLLRRWVYVLRLMRTPNAVARLMAHLDLDDVAVRTRIIAALQKLRHVGTEGDRSRLRNRIHAELDDAAAIATAHASLAGDGLVALRQSLETEATHALDRVFGLLGLLYTPTAIRRATAHVAHPAKDKRAYAHELLEVTLEPRERAELAPWMTEAPLEARMRSVAGRSGAERTDEATALLDLIAAPSARIGSYTRALALHAAIRLNVRGLEQAFSRAPDEDPIVAELRPGGRSTLKEGSMLLVEKVLMLKTVPMFAQTSDELLAEVAQALEIVDLPAGTLIFGTGDVGESMFIVVRGRVRVFSGSETLRTLGEREIFGELALLDPSPRSASVETVEDTRLFRLDEETFSQLMAGSLEIVRGVLHVLCERLRQTTRMAVEHE